jgi:signal transduction histidine kinase
LNTPSITKLTCLLIFVLFLPNISSASNNEIDSLSVLLENNKLADQERILVLNALYSKNLDTDINLAFNYISESIMLAKQFEQEEIFAQTASLYSNILSLQGEYKESISYLFKALKYYEESNNFENIAICFHAIGENYRAQAEHDKALTYLFKGLDISKKHQIDIEIKNIYNRISAVLFEKKEYQKALHYADSSLKHKPALNSAAFLSNTFNIMGALYKELDKFDSALYYLHKSLHLGISSKDWIYVPGSYINIAALHLDKYLYDSCIYYAQESLKISYKTKILTYQETALLQIYRAFKATHAYDSALKYHEDYTGVRWQIFNANRSEMIAEIQTKYDTEKRIQQTEKLQIENELQKSKIFRQQILLLLIIIIVLVALTIPYSLYRQRQKLAKTNTTLIKQNEEIEKQSNQLAELNNTKDKILSIIAHDMINPFQSIIGFSNLLSNELKDSPNNDIRQYAEYISKGTLNLNTLLSNLLKWSQLQVGSLKLNKEIVSIKALSDETLGLFETAIKEKRINCRIDIHADHQAYCDTHSVSTVIRNLVSNAIKFTRFDGTISISTVAKDQELEFTIIDNGVGMDEENLIKLFSLDKAISFGTNNEKGTGFGLILCKEFVEKNGGKIWAESETNKGTTIHFTLPINKD